METSTFQSISKLSQEFTQAYQKFSTDNNEEANILQSLEKQLRETSKKISESRTKQKTLRMEFDKLKNRLIYRNTVTEFSFCYEEYISSHWDYGGPAQKPEPAMDVPRSDKVNTVALYFLGKNEENFFDKNNFELKLFYEIDRKSYGPVFHFTIEFQLNKVWLLNKNYHTPKIDNFDFSIKLFSREFDKNLFELFEILQLGINAN